MTGLVASELVTKVLRVGKSDTGPHERRADVIWSIDRADAAAKRFAVIHLVGPSRAEHDIDPDLVTAVVVAACEVHGESIAVTVDEPRDALARSAAVLAD